MTLIEYPCGCTIEHIGFINRSVGDRRATLDKGAEYRNMCDQHKAAVKQTEKQRLKRDYDNAVKEIDEIPLI